MDKYIEFLRTKVQVAPETGFTVDPTQLNPARHRRNT